MKDLINENPFEVVLAALGAITLLAGLFVGFNQSIGLALFIFSAVAWSVSAVSIGFHLKLRRTISGMTRDANSTQVIPQDQIYSAARNAVIKASEVKATFFADYMWRLHPGERGYETQSAEWGMTESQIADFESYFHSIRKLINAGEMIYTWITYVNNAQKFFALIDRLIKTLTANAVAARRGRLAIYLLPHSAHVDGKQIQIGPPISQVGIQISYSNGVRTANICPMRGRSDPGIALQLTETTARRNPAITAYEQWFDLLKSQCLPVLVDGNVSLDNVCAEARATGIDSKTIADEMSRVEAVINANN